MKESYLTKAFRKTAHERFPEREAMLNSAFKKRLGELRSEHAGTSRQRMRHLESQIMPGIAAYETLQTVMPKEEALRTVHGYVEERAVCGASTWRDAPITTNVCAAAVRSCVIVSVTVTISHMTGFIRSSSGREP